MKSPEDLLEKRASEILKLLSPEDSETLALWGEMKGKPAYEARRLAGVLIVFYIISAFAVVLWHWGNSAYLRAEGYCAALGRGYDIQKQVCTTRAEDVLYQGPSGIAK